MQILILSPHRVIYPFNITVGRTISVLYTIEAPGKPDKLKWFHGTITKLGKLGAGYRRVDILFEDGEIVKGFELHFDKFRKRCEGAWK